jgi:hypothetical protein
MDASRRRGDFRVFRVSAFPFRGFRPFRAFVITFVIAGGDADTHKDDNKAKELERGEAFPKNN